MFLGLFIFQIFISCYSIHEESSFFTHFLQIYCTGLIGLVSQLYWIWALNRDPTIYIIFKVLITVLVGVGFKFLKLRILVKLNYN